MTCTYKIYPNVVLGTNVSIGDFCIIGELPEATGEGLLETVIGDNALIRSHTVIYAGNVIGCDFRTGNHVSILESNRVGDRVSIGTMSVLTHHVTVEDDVRIHTRSLFGEFCILKKGCWIGPGVILINARYPRSAHSKEYWRGVVVGERAVIGAGAMILPGIEIGSGALVGAGSVVSKDVPPGVVVVGNPAKPIGTVSDLKIGRAHV